MDIVIKKIDIKKDERGWLGEIFKPEDVGGKQFGLVLVTTAKPGQTKGNHFHKRKTEWYCVIKGKGLLTLKHNEKNERKEIEVTEKEIVLVKIPPFVSHALTNTGEEELFLLVYVDEPFNSEDPDTYFDETRS